MALTGAERQRRYIDKLKDAATRGCVSDDTTYRYPYEGWSEEAVIRDVIRSNGLSEIMKGIVDLIRIEWEHTASISERESLERARFNVDVARLIVDQVVNGIEFPE